MPQDGDGFSFVQFDFAGPVGVPEGRWVVRSTRDGEADHVLIVAGRQGRRGTRRPRRLRSEPDPPGVGISRVTVIDAAANGIDDPEARRERALAVIATAMTAWRVAALDPFAPETPPEPLAVRVGSGSGEQVAHGRWSDARELPPLPRKPRRRRPSPPEGRFAELLGAREPVPACALLALRARLDLECGRDREAVLTAEAALSCAREELAGVIAPDRIEGLVAHSAAVAAAAAEARSAEPGEDAISAVAVALERLEAALRAVAAGTQS